MKKYSTLVLLLASAPAFAHVGHAHGPEHGILHHFAGAEQWLLGLTLLLAVAYWRRARG